MAQYIGTVEGSRGAVTRLGTKKSGLYARAQGWNVGGVVSIDHVNGQDQVTLTLTAGSNGAKTSKLIGTFTVADLTA